MAVNIEALKYEQRMANRTDEYMADACGMSLASWYNKTGGRTKFTTDDAYNICEAIPIKSNKRKVEIFLAKK